MWFMCSFPPAIVITTAPTDRQVRHLLWGELRQAHGESPVPLGGEILQQEWKYRPDWYAIGFTSREYDPHRFQGFHGENILVIVDEANGVGSEIWYSIRGILTSANAKLLAIGNPHKPEGEFYDAFREGRGERFAISCMDSPNVKAGDTVIPGLVTREAVDEMIADYGRDSPIVQSRVFGEFPEESEDQLIPLAWVERAVERDVPLYGELGVGVDVARFGSDETAFAVRHGDKILAIDAVRKLDTKEVANRTAGYVAQHNCQWFAVDEVGVGAGVLDNLVHENFHAVGVNVGEAAEDGNLFANKRAELWWRLRQRFENGDISIPNDPQLHGQLTSVRYGYDGRGHIVIEKKEALKRRGLRSPDRAEAVLMAFSDAHLVQPDFFHVTQPRIDGEIDFGAGLEL